MIHRSTDGLWRSTLLEAEAWLDHSFGTASQTPPGQYRSLKQVHSTRVFDFHEWMPLLEGDALSAAVSGQAVAVKTADCVPILLADPKRRLVAAIHAGWRGTVDGIAAAAVRHLVARHSADPAGLLAALGPSIGPCCFEIGPDVAPRFEPIFPERADLADRTRVDLREANARLLERSGIDRSRIDTLDIPCTCCGGNEFHSWRRDRATGLRMFSVISIR